MGAGTMESASRDNRMVSYDLLRILAAFSVVMLHSAGQKWHTLPVSNLEWQVADAWDALFRFGVPIFVMISGAIFLNRDIGIRRLYAHNILRLMAVYWVWSGIYGMYDCRSFDLRAAGWKVVAKEMLTGRYHLWFLPMIVGIYMLYPVLRSWVKNTEKENLQYFLSLFLIFQIGMSTLSALNKTFLIRYLADLVDIAELGMACSYVGYFVWGYYLARFGIPDRWRRILYACVIPSALLNIALDRYLSVRAGAPAGEIYDSYGAFTFVVVTALFLFFTKGMGEVRDSGLAARAIRELSDATLGIYVMHIGFLEILEAHGIDSTLLPNIVGIPLLALGCFVACAILAAILRRIPLVGRYLC